MRSFEIFGADRETGTDLQFTLEANDADHAAALANTAGVMVSAVREAPPPLPTPATPILRAVPVPTPWASQTVLMCYVAAVGLLLLAVLLAGHCANALTDADERLRQAQQKAKASHWIGPGIVTYQAHSTSEGVLITPHHIPAPIPPKTTAADVALQEEQQRQNRLRAGLYVVPLLLAAAATGLALVARYKGRPRAGGVEQRK